jgi:fatty acid desaturase
MRNEMVLKKRLQTRVPKELDAQQQAGTSTRNRLEAVRPHLFAYKLLTIAGLTGVLWSAIILTPYPTKVLFQACLGILIAHATELVHQCLHRTATGSPKWDHFLGRILGWPSGTSFWYYCWFHLWHHRHNGTAKDQESFGYNYQLMEASRRVTRYVGFARHLSMINHYRDTLKRMALAIRGRLLHRVLAAAPEMNRRIARKIQQDYQIMAGLLCLIGLLALAFWTLLPFDIWLVPLLIAWGPAHALIELPEHWGCDYPNSSVFENTRSIDAGRFARWLTNNNCNHVGHHYNMNTPMEELPKYEAQLMELHRFKYYEVSYLKFYIRFLRSLHTGSR